MLDHHRATCRQARAPNSDPLEEAWPDPALLTMGPDHFTLRLSGGEERVRIHWTRWWQVTSGHATLRRAPGDWTSVTGTGTVTVSARLHM